LIPKNRGRRELFQRIKSKKIVYKFKLLAYFALFSGPFKAYRLRTSKSNIQKFYTVLTLRYVFCTDLRTNRKLYLIRHYVIGL
jgi:hypothetical protein